jgi:tetrahydromethanopterin:alpha-L-glutamate ligase
MIRIIKKPTDTPGDDSTGAVIQELRRRGTAFSVLDLERTEPLHSGICGDVIWVCGMKQESSYFEILNVLSLDNRVVNTPDAIATCASKARTTALLMKHGVPTPETIFTTLAEDAAAFLSRTGRAVYKPLYGYDGNGIFPFTRVEELGEPPWYLQEYVKNDRDFRVFVIDGKARGAIVRQSDSFAHNIHQGGHGRPVEIDTSMAAIAADAAGAIGIDYCGVDLLLRDGDYTVLEVNGTPNWHCMGVPIPQYLAEFLIQLEKEYTKG